MVHQVSRALPVPIIGIGGIATLFDVVEFMMAGASAVQIGTANFYDPTVSTRLARELREYCIMRKIEKVSTLIGSLQI
jgi:dihydroorotate dehydrogenase (NAD+) catalytic subunit